MNTQFKKGIVEILVLNLLSKRDMYGYEIVELISSEIEITEGTIYPLMRRLKNDDLLETYLRESDQGPPRKYYKIKEKGLEVLKLSLDEWLKFSHGVNKLLEREDYE